MIASRYSYALLAWATIQEFHQSVLSDGALPLGILRDRVRARLQQ